MFAGVRFVLAGLMVFCFTWGKSRRIPTIPKQRVGGVLLYGALQTGLMYILNYIGVANTTATKTSIITAASAFFAVVFSKTETNFVGFAKFEWTPVRGRTPTGEEFVSRRLKVTPSRYANTPAKNTPVLGTVSVLAEGETR